MGEKRTGLGSRAGAVDISKRALTATVLTADAANLLQHRFRQCGLAQDSMMYEAGMAKRKYDR